MRLTIALALTAATAGFATDPAAQTTRATSAVAERAEDLKGVWTGQWTADDGARGGAAEMIIAPDPSRPGIVAAHVTFVDGSVAETALREGRVTRRGAFFDLVGGGALVVTLEESGRRLTGEFAGGPDLPARAPALSC